MNAFLMSNHAVLHDALFFVWYVDIAKCECVTGGGGGEAWVLNTYLTAGAVLTRQRTLLLFAFQTGRSGGAC